MAVAINFFRVKARQAYRQIRERIARINAYLGEAISGWPSFSSYSGAKDLSRIRRAQ
jgi:ABC-type multidrug transport system fused ATPase/permease subunit